ncbi:MAG: DHH family phosphoesterase [Thermoguttaceae bacterium]
MRAPDTAEQPSLQVDWPRFVDFIGARQKILLTTHHRPDCDAAGSELGMLHILMRLGKEVMTANPFELPPNLRFLDPGGHLRHFDQVPGEYLRTADLILVLDTTAWAQLGGMGDVIRAFQGDVAVMDHHVSGDDLGATLFKDTTAEATGRLVFEAARHLGVEVTPEIATPIFAALATDTGWFRFASTTRRTFELAAQIVGAGAQPDRIYKDLYECETLARVKLTGRALARTVTELDGRLIYTWIGLDDFDACGALPGDSEDLVNMTLAVDGTQFALIFVEQRTGGFKISFRSRCDVDCSQLAARFGGGGHKKAAGAFVAADSVDHALSAVLETVRQALTR